MYWKCAWSICVILNVVQDTASRGYALKCPEASQRSMRARLVCGKEVWYHCLYDENERRYVETCEIAKELTTGRKAVYSGNIDARVCSSRRYMPFIYISNMSADCLYQRSYCNEEGQIQLQERSSAEDIACLCDFTKGYAFVTEPKAVCFCVPSEEDCSCYKKTCQDNSYMLSPDYRCVPRTSSISGVRCQVSLSKIPEDTERLKRNYTENIPQLEKWNLVAAKVVTGLFVCCLIVTCAYLVIIRDIGYDAYNNTELKKLLLKCQNLTSEYPKVVVTICDIDDGTIKEDVDGKLSTETKEVGIQSDTVENERNDGTIKEDVDGKLPTETKEVGIQSDTVENERNDGTIKEDVDGKLPTETKEVGIKSDDGTIKEDVDGKLPTETKEVGIKSEVDIFRINCISAEKVLYLDGEKLQIDKNEPRILDVCFMNIDYELFLLYIDADNDTIVRRAVDDCEKYDQAKFQKPNRLTKVDNTRVAIIHKKKFDIDIFDVENMTTEKSYVGMKRDFEVKGIQYYIEGLVALSPNEIILSNKERLFIATLNEGKVTIADYADSIDPPKFDTARRLTCTTVPPNDAKIIFIADENDKTITSIGESGNFICTLDSHNRGLQNVRSIAATGEYVIAATSAGVSVYTHDSKGYVNKEYSMLIEYNVHVDHTRGLCIETIGNRMFLALSCVIKRKDVIAVFAFETSDLKKLRK